MAINEIVWPDVPNPKCNCDAAYAKGEHCNNCDIFDPSHASMGCNCKMSNWGMDDANIYGGEDEL